MDTKVFESLDEPIRSHIDALSKAPETPKLNDIRELLAINWTEKFELFVSQSHLLAMHELNELENSDDRGLIALTYSGSLVSIGPRRNKGRWIEYVSIHQRADVPEIVSSHDIDFNGQVKLGLPLLFNGGPLKETSPVFRLAVCAADVSAEDQDKRIREAAIFLTNGFMKINRGLSEHREKSADQFTIKGIASYLARKNDITVALARKLMEDYLSTIESGLLLGERVSFGKLGQAQLKSKPAQKARILKNPKTQAEVLVAAKPETAVPHFSFSSNLKEKALTVDPSKL